MIYRENYGGRNAGRTGRNGKIGKAYTFVVGKEKSKLLNIQKYANTKIIKGKIPTLEEINKVKNQKIVDNIEEMIEAVKSYGEKTYLIGGNTMQYGNDKDEIIIRNAEVIAILR